MSKKNVLRFLPLELIEDEGFECSPYDDHLGFKTIGIGFNIHFPGKCAHPDLEPYARGEKDIMSKSNAKRIVRDIISTVVYVDAYRIFGPDIFDRLTVGQKVSICNMLYQLGYDRFRGFKKMIDAIKRKDWKKAQDEAKDSKWFNQTQKSRTTRVIEGLAP